MDDLFGHDRWWIKPPVAGPAVHYGCFLPLPQSEALHQAAGDACLQFTAAGKPIRYL